MPEYTKQDSRTATILSSVGHPVRLKIVEILGDQRMRMEDIAVQLGADNSRKIWCHVKKLTDLGLISKSRAGKQVFYGLAGQDVFELVSISRRITQIIQNGSLVVTW